MKSFAFTALLLLLTAFGQAAEPIKALIVEGQNNHKVWPTTTKMMKLYLEQTNLFTVDVATAAPKGTDPNFKPDFSKYDVVVNNFGHGAAAWPKETQQAFEKFVGDGGGHVVIHAADNAFPEWPAYNEMIGLGGWGGRSEKSGPYVYLNDKGDLVRDTSKGKGGNHGKQWEFPVVVRDSEHPITKGMPVEWLHTKDELYDQLRGPAQNMEILATAESQVTNRHEPMIFTVKYGKGRVFHTPMGHAEYSMECVGFITTLQRGTEWAATGNVTVEIPDDFPKHDKTSSRKWTAATDWKPLFNGKNLDNWKVTDFGGQGEVKVQNDSIVITQGVDLSGITSTRKDLPKVDYEIEFEAQRAQGSDFFIGLTFPVGESFCSLICGGWGGGIFGLSSLDGMDASENETTGYTNFTNGQWYKTRVRVTSEKIEAWLDKTQIVDVETEDRQVGVRFEMEMSTPVGFATYQSTAHIRNARIRTVATSAKVAKGSVEKATN